MVCSPKPQGITEWNAALNWKLGAILVVDNNFQLFQFLFPIEQIRR